MKNIYVLLGSIGSLSINAQNKSFALHSASNSEIYVNSDALVSVYGSLTVNDGKVQNNGMVKSQAGSADDVFTVFSSSDSKFINTLNQPLNFSLANTIEKGNNYTYGQLYVSGYNQNLINGKVTQQYRNVNHGSYQQIGIPFSNKEINSLSTELGKSFSPVRWSQNEILKYNSGRVVFDNINFSNLLSDPSGYYILGNKNNSLDVSSLTRNIQGTPYTDGSNMSFVLQNAGNGVNFGTNGSAVNEYNERYNSYLQDGFEIQQAAGGTAWQGNYGKNIYQFSNPFLMNIDLRSLFFDDDVYGIRLEQAGGTVNYTTGVGGGAGSFRYVTWDSENKVPVGDVDWLIIRPLSVFSIKLKSNSPKVVDFNTIRNFSYVSKNSFSGKSNVSATVKQLAVIALDAENKEIGRTYYVVSPNAVSGHSAETKYQIAANSTDVIGTYEENKEIGNYDDQFTDKYWLYINEANEDNFKGKSIPTVIYDSKVKSLKFEVRENSELLTIGTAELSTGIPFYYKIGNDLLKISQNLTIPVTTSTPLELKLFYDKPSTTLNPNDAIAPSRTRVVWNSEIKQWMILFDSRWNLSDIEIYDMSGRLILTKRNYQTEVNYIIDLPNVSQVYMVKAVSEKGEVVVSKIKF